MTKTVFFISGKSIKHNTFKSHIAAILIPWGGKIVLKIKKMCNLKMLIPTSLDETLFTSRQTFFTDAGTRYREAIT